MAGRPRAGSSLTPRVRKTHMLSLGLAFVFACFVLLSKEVRGARGQIWNAVTQAFDVNRDNCLTFEETTAWLAESGGDASGLDILFKVVDVDRDGCLTFSELRRLAAIYDEFPGASRSMQTLGDGLTRVSQVLLAVGIAVAVWLVFELNWEMLASYAESRKLRAALDAARKDAKTKVSEERQLKDRIVELETLEQKYRDGDWKRQVSNLAAALDQAQSLRHEAEGRVTEIQKDAEQRVAALSLQVQRLRVTQACLSVGSRDITELEGATVGFAVCGGSVFGSLGEGANDADLFMLDTELLGEGRRGAFTCQKISQDEVNEKFAVKKYEIKRGAAGKSDDGREMMTEIVNELRAFQDISNHENIVSYRHVIETERYVYILMELLEGVDMDGFIRNLGAGEFVEESCARLLFKQLTSAIKHMHDRKVVHGDIKPSNGERTLLCLWRVSRR